RLCAARSTMLRHFSRRTTRNRWIVCGKRAAGKGPSLIIRPTLIRVESGAARCRVKHGAEYRGEKDRWIFEAWLQRPQKRRSLRGNSPQAHALAARRRSEGACDEAEKCWSPNPRRCGSPAGTRTQPA